MCRACIVTASILLAVSCSSRPSTSDIEAAVAAAVTRTSENNISLRSLRQISSNVEIVECELEIVFNTNCRWMGSGASGLTVFKTKPVSPDGKGAWPMYTFGEVQKRPELLEGELVTPGTSKKITTTFKLKKENGIWIAVE